MKISARELSIAITDTGKAILSFRCSLKALQALSALKSGDYELSIVKEENKRTNAQNRYLWELIGQICMAEDGNTSGDIDLYCMLVEQAGVKCEYLMGLPELEARLNRLFRVVKAVDDRTYNGQQMKIYKCYYGSSKMDTAEMAKLIDKTIEYAERVGIDTDYWRRKLYDRNE